MVSAQSQLPPTFNKNMQTKLILTKNRVFYNHGLNKYCFYITEKNTTIGTNQF